MNQFGKKGIVSQCCLLNGAIYKEAGNFAGYNNPEIKKIESIVIKTDYRYKSCCIFKFANSKPF